ncbi:VanZ family protein [Paenibacillus sp. FSL R7-0337]|uniref:VanZ family protein n=1 Tax=Paenibacillus sp. FSL R7-0337 TaxID=1926588 RepID=UPI00096F13AD|nr:VanZ family protein [Paenibacillus sp. FSL R7-0337]OMF90342.1 hypothetical protein BK147_23415 [Paenibacillus sp. FSL R7-0337]
MKRSIIIIWGAILFVFTCAANSSFWESGTIPNFHFIFSPNYNDLFIIDLKATPAYVIRKIGHFSGFAFFAIFIWIQNRSFLRSAFYSIAYAILTELLQLYFGRDGRLYDIVIDSLGILMALITIKTCFDKSSETT